MEIVLGAILGPDDRIDWLYEQNGPNRMRAALVHEGWSEVEVASNCDLRDYCQKLTALIEDIVERVIYRAWKVPVDPPDYKLFHYADSVMVTLLWILLFYSP